MIVITVAVIKVLIITLFGWALARFKYIGRNVFDFLNKFLVDFAATFLIFVAIVENHAVIHQHNIIKFLLFSVVIFLLGWTVSLLIYHGKMLHSEFAGLVSFQNCGYLPLTITVFLLSAESAGQFQVYIFLYLLGFNVLMWSVGSYFLFRHSKEKFGLKTLLSPPVSGTILALLFVYTGTAKWLPQIILSPMKMIGDMTFVLSAIVLGGWLAQVNLKGIKEHLYPLVLASIARLVIIPAIFFIVVMYAKMYSLIGLFVILIAAMPSAISLPVVVNMKNGDTDFVSQGVFITHVAGILTITFWLGLFLTISGFKF